MDSKLDVVKAICKISAAMTNLDEIPEDSKHFSGRFKKEYTRFFDFFLHHTEETTKAMYKANPAEWQRCVYNCMDEIEDAVDADSDELKHISIMLAKLSSALVSLKQIEKSVHGRLIADPLINKLKPLVSKGYFKKLPINKEGFAKLANEITIHIDKEILV